VLQNLEITVCSLLFGFIKGLNDDSDTSFVAGVFSIVTIEKSYSLLFMTPGEPIAYKILDLSNVHKLNVINMSKLLPFNNHIGRDTLTAHSFRVRLVIFTGAVNLIPHLRGRKAVVAFDIVGMNSLAL